MVQYIVGKYYFVGSGIASLAGAAYLIRDADVAGDDIVIFEESREFGGALDAHGDATTGFFMSGSRMFEHKYNCTFELMSSIPSASDPSISVTEETNRAEAEARWENKARLVGRDGEITDFHVLGFNEVDRIDLVVLMATSEHSLDSKRVNDWFSDHFFQTNFWFEWSTLFAFQPWHSAIEFRRYLLRFIHHFSTIDTQKGVYRTHFNQYDSMAVPLVKWLTDKGVTIRFATQVIDLGFTDGGTEITVESIKCLEAGAENEIQVGEKDCVFVTNGSMTADKTFGSMSSAPGVDRGKRSGAWQLWQTLARGRPQFGDPSVFDDHVDESMWESFTATVSNPTFFDLMQKFSGSEAGKGGLITFKDSSWLITISIFHQPFFRNQPDDAFVWWGYGLHHDKLGDYVKKTMAECTGREILEEVLGHLHFLEQRDAILDRSNVIPCMMPYITSQFLVRKAGDRPKVVPDGSTNLAFIGQFSELPDDVVFTVEYSIRSAQIAVYSLLKLGIKPVPMYKGFHDPRILLQALETLHRVSPRASQLSRDDAIRKVTAVKG
jgi:oleate hydratase